MSKIMETAVEILQQAVREAGSLRKAAARLGVSHAALSNWINGKRGSQIDGFLTVLEKLGARLKPKEIVPELHVIHKEPEGQDQKKIDVLTGQVEILQKIIYGMNGKKVPEEETETKKDAG